MSKQTFPLKHSEVSEDLGAKVEKVIFDLGRRRFSVSAIYAVHNEVFGLKEAPQTCPSCLERRAKKVAEWYNEQEKIKQAEEAQGESADNVARLQKKINDLKEGAKLGEYAKPEGSIDYPALNKAGEDSGVIVFTPSAEDDTKGTVTLDDGTYVKPGAYTSGDVILSVAVGGKATVTSNLN